MAKANIGNNSYSQLKQTAMKWMCIIAVLMYSLPFLQPEEYLWLKPINYKFIKQLAKADCNEMDVYYSGFDMFIAVGCNQRLTKVKLFSK